MALDQINFRQETGNDVDNTSAEDFTVLGSEFGESEY